MQFIFNAKMLNNQNIFISNDNYGDIPPHIESYYQDDINEHVFISHLSQPSERDENVRMARFLAEKTKESVFILPHIQPTQKKAKELRKNISPRE